MAEESFSLKERLTCRHLSCRVPANFTKYSTKGILELNRTRVTVTYPTVPNDHKISSEVDKYLPRYYGDLLRLCSAHMTN